MKVFVLNETANRERRCVLTPTIVPLWRQLGVEIYGERTLGQGSLFPDASFEEQGMVWLDRQTGLKTADVILSLNGPKEDEIPLIKPKSLLVGLLKPSDRPDYLAALAKQEVEALSLELIPRITRAQSMDVLTSQSNLAGYAAALRGAREISIVTPMMTTAAGTIRPARFFIVGAGVAGLQAIATAKRLGAIVEAFDARQTVEEQVRSLGAKFLKIELGKTEENIQGYAHALSENQLQLQRKAMVKACSLADVVITTAKVFAGKAPRLIDRDMIDQMRPGSVILDLAISAGGNVEGSRPDELIISENGVKIWGLTAPENDHPQTASQLLSTNIFKLFQWCLTDWQATETTNEILKACRVTHCGQVTFNTK